MRFLNPLSLNFESSNCVFYRFQIQLVRQIRERYFFILHVIDEFFVVLVHDLHKANLERHISFVAVLDIIWRKLLAVFHHLHLNLRQRVPVPYPSFLVLVNTDVLFFCVQYNAQ